MSTRSPRPRDSYFVPLDDDAGLMSSRWGLYNDDGDLLVLLRNVHFPTQCRGQYCVIHHPSIHHMNDWPLVTRETGLIERHCPHGIGHPDPDSLRYFKDLTRDDGWGVHGCDGCCRPPAAKRPIRYLPRR